VEEGDLAASKKNLAPNDTIVFLDESGFSERPSVRRTWAPRGRTPVLKARARSWSQVSVIGAIAYRRDGRRARLLMMLHEGATSSEETRIFLQYLRRHVRGKVLLIWDGVGFHHSGWLNAWIKSQQHWLKVRRLPPYAPELNPVEGLWAWIKGSQMPNFSPDSIDPVLERIGSAARKLESRSALLMAFLRKAGLSL
jgi:transposase